MSRLARLPQHGSMRREWRTSSRRTLLVRPPWLEVGEERVELPNGRVINDFLWLREREFAIVVALTADREVVLERCYKHGPRVVALTLPAGFVEEGEAAVETARRELLEETGYEAERWTGLGRYVVHGNYGLGAMNAFLAFQARRTHERQQVDNEELELVLRPFREMPAAIAAGEIAELSSAAALGLAAMHLGRGSPA